MDYSDRLAKLEARLNRVEQRLGMGAGTATPPPAPPLKPAPIALEVERSRLGLWLEENWIIGFGILMVVLAVSWFISYAIANNWIGETARILLSVGAGMAVYAFGLFNLKKRLIAGQALLILGEAIVILSLLAGHYFYDLLSPLSVFSLLFASTAVTTLVALLYRLEGVGLASIAAALSLPFLISFNFGDLLIINYFLSISAASLFMLLNRGWGSVFHCTWVAAIIYLSNFLSFDQSITYFYIPLFYLLFFIPSALCASEKGVKGLQLDGKLILTTSTLALLFWIDLFKTDSKHLIYLLAALPSLYFSYLLAKNWDLLKKRGPTFSSSAVIFALNAMVFVFLAIWFSDLPRTLCYLSQTMIALIAARYIFKAPAALLVLAFYFLVPIASFLLRLPNKCYLPFFSLGFLALNLLAASFAATLLMIHKCEISTRLANLKNGVTASLSVLIGLSLMLLTWNICHYAFANDNIAHGVALTIYILGAEALIYLGHSKQLKQARIGGISLIVFVLYRLFFLEIGQMPVEIRTITFVVGGVLLIGTAWFDKRSLARYK